MILLDKGWPDRSDAAAWMVWKSTYGQMLLGIPLSLICLEFDPWCAPPLLTGADQVKECEHNTGPMLIFKTIGPTQVKLIEENSTKNLLQL